MLLAIHSSKLAGSQFEPLIFLFRNNPMKRMLRKMAPATSCVALRPRVVIADTAKSGDGNAIKRDQKHSSLWSSQQQTTRVSSVESVVRAVSAPAAVEMRTNLPLITALAGRGPSLRMIASEMPEGMRRKSGWQLPWYY